MSQTSGVLYFKDIQLEPGSVATPFERRPIGTELALCQRYYQHYTSTAQYGVQIVGYTTAGQNVLASLPIPPMRATPTGSFIGTWVNNNTTGPVFAIASGSTNNIVIYAPATALGVVVTYSPANGGYDLNAEL